MKRFLGLDYGLSYVGVAVNVGNLAEPLISVKNDRSLLSELKRLIEQYQITNLVLGCSEGKMAEKTLIFGQLLEKTFSLPVVYVDETLSSQEAQTDVSWLGGKKKRRRPLHQFAAAIILERFLDEQSDFKV